MFDRLIIWLGVSLLIKHIYRGNNLISLYTEDVICLISVIIRLKHFLYLLLILGSIILIFLSILRAISLASFSSKWLFSKTAAIFLQTNFRKFLSAIPISPFLWSGRSRFSQWFLSKLMTFPISFTSDEEDLLHMPSIFASNSWIL